MEREEPELTALHRLTEVGSRGACGAGPATAAVINSEVGRVHPEVRERFALFLVGWLGGPQDYVAQHGHPRLRMRHMHVPVDERMRDAWLRSMSRALDECGVTGELRAFLDQRFAEVADFMRNQGP